ncbi:MFS transporter [Novosphingobium sp. BL-8H]|uniref:MFS transporter n=1 Tax=Novosphingobium sp. BL-8H TaxID=3127640 RepID=UPI0037582EE7
MQAQWVRLRELRVILYCAMALFVSGYAFQALSFSMPGLVQDWKLDGALIGPLLSSAIVGLLPGYVLLAPLADRMGERPIIRGAMLGLALATVVCILAPDVEMLMLGRVLTGIAIGAALPCAVAIASRHGTPRWRSAQVVGIYVAFSLGFLASGLMSGWLVPRLGWRAAWIVTVPVALLTAMLLGTALPAEKPKARIDRPLPALFVPRLRAGTVLLWIMFSIGLGLFYAIQSWLPLLAAREGLPYSSAVTATTLFTLGTALGALPMIWWADRIGPFPALVAMNGVGLVGIVLLGVFAARGGMPFHAAAMLAGIGIGGGQKGTIAAASLFYPPTIRATALGWALGIGRIGAACGPLLIGYLTLRDFQGGAALLCLALPVPVVMLAAGYMGRKYGRIDSTDDDPVLL